MSGMLGALAVRIVLLNIAALSASIGLAQVPPTASTSATVDGVIINRGFSAVTVLLERTPTDPLSSFDGYSTTVESDGSFHFEDIQPGAYRLIAEAKPAMFGEYGARPPEKPGELFQVRPGDHLHGVSLELFADPETICGHVVNAHGEPVQVNVEEYSYSYKGDEGRFANPVQPTKRTDANGYFSFPGHSDEHRMFVRADGVWYPSTEDFAKAVPLAPKDGAHTDCEANIKIEHAECRHNLTWKFDRPLEYPTSEYKALLYAVHPTGTLFLTDAHPLYRSDGVGFDQVCDGSYLAAVERGSYSNRQYSATPVFQVNESSAEPLMAEVSQAEFAKLAEPKQPDASTGSVTAKLKLEGLSWKQACPGGVSRQIELKREGDYNGKFELVNEQGEFAAGGLKPGDYRLTFGETARGAAYIKSFTVDGHLADPAHFTIAPGQEANLEAVFSNDVRNASGHLRADYTSEPHYLPSGTHPASSISGSVVGAGAEKMTVKLTSLRSLEETPLERVTSASGAFDFDSVDPGIYELSTKGEGHQYSAYGAKGPGLEGMPIVLTAGQHMDGVTLPTYPKSSLCGRVLDSEGNPRTGIEVWALGYKDGVYDRGTPVTWKKHSITDTQGRYTIPGVGPSSGLLIWAQNGDKKTYFPSQSEDSQQFYVGLGTKDSDCIYDIYLPSPGKTQADRGYSVSGIIEGPLDKSLGDHFFVNLDPVDRVSTPVVMPLELTSEGPFEFKGVWPGKYTVTYSARHGNGYVPCSMPSSICMGYFHYTLASQQIAVTNAEVKGLRLKAGSLPSLDGELLLDGKPPDAENRIDNLTLSGDYSETENATAKLDGDGHFSFKTLDVWKYRIALERYDSPYYVQSIELDGKPVVGEHIQLQYGQSAHLVVRLATDGASGTIVPTASQPPIDSYRDLCRHFGGFVPQILMIPEPLPADNTGIVQGTYTTDGEDRFRQVPPGNYRILAVDGVVMPRQGFIMPYGTIYLSNHDDLVKLAALGTLVEVSAKQDFNWSAPIVTEQMRRMRAEEVSPATF